MRLQRVSALVGIEYVSPHAPMSVSREAAPGQWPRVALVVRQAGSAATELFYPLFIDGQSVPAAPQ